MNINDKVITCTGCGGCANVCPKDAISIKYDINGFLKPFISNDKCVQCSRCVSVCPVLETQKNRYKKSYYYGSINDKKRSQTSSSGGMFAALADKVIELNGVVYGAAYNSDYSAVEAMSTADVSVERLQGSKYVQSNTKNVFRSISKDLKEGKIVLFCATPCQIAAARNIFKENLNLILVDFICGGVTPATVFSSHMRWLEQRCKSTITSINFRDKAKGWNKPHIRITFANGKEYFSSYHYDYYYYYYYCTKLMKNEHCLQCSFTRHEQSDITIADFWGYKRANLTDIKEGVSLFVVNSAVGQRTLDLIKNNVSLTEISEDLANYAYEEKKCTGKELDERKSFLEQIRREGFDRTAEKNYFRYGKLGVLAQRIIKRIVK